MSATDLSNRPRRSARRRKVAAAVLAIAFTVGGLAATAAPANAVVVGECTMKANDPHPSGHISGRINSEGSMRCTIGMDEIYIRAYLEKAGGSSWGGTTESWVYTVPGRTFSSFANTSCSEAPGTFRTRVSYTFRSPAGVNPAYTANTIYSPWKGVACGVSRMAPQAEQSERAAWTSENPLPEGVTMTATEDGAELTFSFNQ